MKAIRLFIASAVLLAVALWLLFDRFNGNTHLSVGSTLSSVSFEISGSAKGGFVAAALILLFAAAIVFIWAVIAAIAGQMRPPAARSSHG